MRERIIERYLTRKVKEAGGECLKWVSPGRRGVHDRICVFPNNVVVFVETKSKTGKLRPEQARFHAHLMRLRCKSHVVRTKLQAKKLVELYST